MQTSRFMQWSPVSIVIGHGAVTLSLTDSAWWSLPTLCCFAFALHWLLSNRVNNGHWLPQRRYRRNDWQRHVVVVTGGAGGVGALLGVRLADAGAQVAAIDIVDAPSVTKSHENILPLRCDITDRSSVAKAAAEIADKLGSVTMLVNNAGVVTPPWHAYPLEQQGAGDDDETAARTKKTIDVNLLASYWTLRQWLPSIVEAGGQIVTVASTMALVGVPRLADYVASKHGLVGLHASLQRELKHSDHSRAREVQTTLVLPAHISTPLFPFWEYPWPFNWITPSVTPDYVADRIFCELEARRSSTIYLPVLTAITQWMSVMPVWMREAAQWASGADHAIENMRRRAAAAHKQRE